MRILTLVILFAIVIPAFAHTSYTGYSGAPGRGTCAGQCHGSAGGSVTVSGFPAVYTQNQQYLITLRHLSGSAIANFNGSCRVGTGTTNGGTIVAGSGTATYSVSGETNGIHLNSDNRDTATFYWTAPEIGTGTVRLYLAGLQGGHDGQNTTIVAVSDEFLYAPNNATRPRPADQADNVFLNQVLSWTRGNRATSHDVYFGTDIEPPFIGNQTDTTYIPQGGLTPGTTYYWRIDEWNDAGMTPGLYWRFSTMALPAPASHPIPSSGITVAMPDSLYWTGGAGTTVHYIYLGATNPPPLIDSLIAYRTAYHAATLPNTTYYWHIDEHNQIGFVAGPLWQFSTEEANNAEDAAEGLPTELWLGEAYPNPFNAAVTIPFALPQAGQIEISLYDLLGQRVAMLVSGQFAAGTHQVQWHSNLSGSGLYFIRLSEGTQTFTRKIIALK